jgi:hypothetical protein
MGLASSRRFRTTCPWPCAGWGSIGPYGDPVHEYGLDALGRSRRIVAVREIEHTIGVKDREAEKLSGVTLPAGRAFHMLRHSHAMWRRLFADADTAALVASGLWKSRNAASVYEHLDLSAESRKSDLFPTPTRAKGGR